MNFKKLALAVSLALAGVSANAGYYVMVPLKGALQQLQGISVSLNSAALPVALVNQPYSYDLKPALVVTGDASYTGAGVSWAVSSGSLPAGLTLGSDGVISGSPAAAGTSSFSVKATYRKLNGEQAYQILTKTILVGLSTATVPQALVGQAYNYDLKPHLTVSNDPDYIGAGVSWSVVSSTLPTGLTLRTDGTLGGTPTAAGSGTLVARASYKGSNGEQTYQVVALNISVGLASATPPEALVGQAYTYDLKSLLTVSGDAAYSGSGVSWSVVSSTLPAGLTLRTDGTIGGTPTASGSGTLVARATYRGVNGEQTYQVVTLNISVALAAAALPDATVGQAYSYDFKPRVTVTGDPAYTVGNVGWNLASGSLPAGLALNSATGVVSGTPAAVGAAQSFALRAGYRGFYGQQTYSMNVVSGAFGFNLVLTSNVANYNLKSAAIAAGWDGVKALNASVVINPGVYVYSNNTSIAAFTVDALPAGSLVSVTNNGYIYGAGGKGGSNLTSEGGSPGLPGGPALSVAYAVSVTNNGTIAGGGGGGGSGAWDADPYGANGEALGGGGGGGASYGQGGSGNASGGSGSLTAGGAGGSGAGGGGDMAGLPFGSGRGGNGGAPGSAGSSGGSGGTMGLPGGGGGAAGPATIGNSRITWSATGTRLGALN